MKFDELPPEVQDQLFPGLDLFTAMVCTSAGIFCVSCSKGDYTLQQYLPDEHGRIGGVLRDYLPRLVRKP